MNDSKYGYSVRDNNMGLSLLKASKFPDHEADMGPHDFVYSLLPHDRALEDSTVFEEAHKLNTPLWAAVFTLQSEEPETIAHIRDSITQSSFIEIDQPNVVVSALKQSEDASDIYILRIHEERGE